MLAFWFVNEIAGFFVLVVVTVVIFMACNGLFIAIKSATFWLAETTATIMEILGNLILQVTSGIAWVLFWPARFVGGLVFGLIETVMGPFEAWREENRALRCLYNEEYRQVFRSFQAFKRYWTAVQNGGDADPASYDKRG